MLFVLCIFSASSAYPQVVKGKFLSNTNNLTVIKVWGSHEERGYAVGHLMADKIETLLSNYIRGRFPSNYYLYARVLLQDSTHLKFEEKYIEEAEAMIEGMKSVRSISSDYLDILIANSFLDILGFLGSENNENSKYGCSSLMSWGTATSGTFLQGKSIITRNLDWEPDTNLCANQVMVIHIPSESNEQPWAMIGFAGQMGVLSGTNASGLTVFQHVLHVASGAAPLAAQFEPIWMTLRKALEERDYNNDGKNNTADVQAALSSNPQGYAASCIISSMASSDTNVSATDSLVALVSEVTHAEPRLTFRSTAYNDSIPNQNLYAANAPIKRENALDFEPRYFSVINSLGTGLMIDSSRSWNIMRDSSRVVDGNIELIQVIPEMKLLRISVFRNLQCAYSTQPVNFGLDSLFSPVVHTSDTRMMVSGYNLEQNYPNPFNPNTVIRFSVPERSHVTINVYNQLGEKTDILLSDEKDAGTYSISWSGVKRPSGVYYYEMVTENSHLVKKLVLIK